jgi:hypothetical protein
MIASGLDADARAILARELERRNGLLGSLPETSRAVVQEAAERTVVALTKAIVELAAEEPAVAAAIHSIYATQSLADPAAVAAPSD